MTKATYSVVYQGKDITADLGGELMGITYRDKTEGEADELTLRVKDEAHKWMDGWNPVKGDKVSAQIMSNGVTLGCGDFTVDEISFSGNRTDGHVALIKALGAGVVDRVRTKSSFAHEGKTLAQIAQKYADKYNFRVQGIIHNYSIARVTQFHEGDLEFLERVALEFGYMFSLRGNVLVFTYLPEFCKTAPALTVDFGSLMDYEIRDKIAGIYVRGQYRYHNRKEKKTYDGHVAAGANPSVDVFRAVDHIDSDEQGLYKVDGRMYKKNLTQVEIDATMPGNTYMCAGVLVGVTGFYKYSGNYFLGESTHEVDGENNYVTSCQYKKILENEGTGNANGTEVGYGS